jgi:VCBS repeat-containing protein
VIDPEARTLLGTFSSSGYIEPDSRRGLTFVLNGNQLQAFDQQTFLSVGSLTIPGITAAVPGLISWGDKGLAFRSNAFEVVLVEWDPRQSMGLRTHSVTLPAGQIIAGRDFGNLNTSPITSPVANHDSYQATEDTLLSVAAPGILANDTDSDGDPLSAVLATGPVHGTLTLIADGRFTFAPVANYHGPDSFTYRASDGTVQSEIATVSITVAAVNDSPLANADLYSVAEDMPFSFPGRGVLFNDVDPDGDELLAKLETGPAHGVLILEDDGNFLYTPAADFNGPDSFTYRASDGEATSGIAAVSLNVNAVNDAPLAVADWYGVPEDTLLTIAVPAS